MGIFKFKRVKNKFRWESHFMALEFSNPSIQGYYDYIVLDNPNQIMYYYYNVKIYRKFDDWDKNDNEIVKWELVSERGTHDFPNILELKYILEHQLKDDTRIGGQKHTFRSGETCYSKTFSTDGFACDDFYEVTKFISDYEESKDRYIVYCGTTFDYQGDLNSSGIRTPYVEEDDILCLKQCVEEFIKFSIDEHNREILLLRESIKSNNNKIYQYDVFNKSKNNLEAIYVVGDNVDIIKVVDNIETSIDNVVITEINDNTLKLSDGSKIKISNIVYLNINSTDEMLKYKQTEIAEDFLNTLCKDEIEEFKYNPVSKLFKKYKEAIINRTSMCRTEHEFEIDYTSGAVLEKLNPIILDIIFVIKKMILTNKL